MYSSDIGSKAHNFSFTASWSRSNMIHSGDPAPCKDHNKLNVEWLGGSRNLVTWKIVLRTKLLVIDQRQLSTHYKKMKLSLIRSFHSLGDMSSAHHSLNQRSRRGNGKMTVSCSVAITVHNMWQIECWPPQMAFAATWIQQRRRRRNSGRSPRGVLIGTDIAKVIGGRTTATKYGRTTDSGSVFALCNRIICPWT